MKEPSLSIINEKDVFLRQNTHKLFSLPALAFSLPFSFSFTSLHLKHINTSFNPFYHSILLPPFSIFLTFHLLPRCSLYPFLSLSLFFPLYFPVNHQNVNINQSSFLVFEEIIIVGRWMRKLRVFLIFFSPFEINSAYGVGGFIHLGVTFV